MNMQDGTPDSDGSLQSPGPMVSVMSAENSSGAATTICGSSASMAQTPGMDAFRCMDTFQERMAELTTQFEQTLSSAPDGVPTAELEQARASMQTVRRLTFDPEYIHHEVHVAAVATDALPLVMHCPRCEQPGHRREQCRGKCATCQHEHPDCDSRCPMRLDQSTELLAICAESFPPVQTTDLDTGTYVPMAESVVAAAARSGLLTVPDAEVVSRYGNIMHARYAKQFPPIMDMMPTQWLPMLDEGQLARLCRGVGQVELVLDECALGGAAHGTLRWDASSKAKVHAAYGALRETLFAIRDEITELVQAVLHI